MDSEMMKWLVQLGVGGVIAGLMFWAYRKDVKQFTELWRMQAELNFRQTDAMMALVRETTIAITRNTEVLKSLHRRIDRLDMLKFVPDPIAPD
jgi:hypothetical protein